MSPGAAGTPSAVGRPGHSLAHYVCLQRIARGGMAELYIARRQGPGGFRKLVALKRLLPHLAEDPAFARMFITEARLAAGLEHPHLAQVLDFGELEGRSFLAMEYVHGQDLRGVLRAAGRHFAERRIDLPCALAILDMVADGLHYAHERRGSGGKPLGLVHRDVSPSNVLVGYDGSVKLTDFGIAKATEETQATATDSLKGKIAYMSPEQARGEPVDRRSDVFSFGIVLFELTTGFRLFTGPSEFVILNKVAKGEVVPPRDVVDDYPEDLQRIVMRALALSVDDRYPTVRAVSEDLRAFGDAGPGRSDRAGLSAMMHALFEVTPYPDVDAEISIPVVANAGVDVNANTVPRGPATEPLDLGPATRSRYDPEEDDEATVAWSSTGTSRRRMPAWGWAGLALTAGLGIGLGVANSGSRDTESKASPTSPAPEPAKASAPTPPAPTPSPSTSDTTGTASTSTGDTGDTGGSDETTNTGAEASLSTAPRARTRPRRKKGKGKGKTKTKNPGLDRWKPPSER